MSTTKTKVEKKLNFLITIVYIIIAMTVLIVGIKLSHTMGFDNIEITFTSMYSVIDAKEHIYTAKSITIQTKNDLDVLNSFFGGLVVLILTQLPQMSLYQYYRKLIA